MGSWRYFASDIWLLGLLLYLFESLIEPERAVKWSKVMFNTRSKKTVDIVQTLSCCWGVKASILADRKTWHINSLEEENLIHYQVSTFPPWATPRPRTTPLLGSPGLPKAYLSFSESPLAYACFLLRPPPGENSLSPLYKNTHIPRFLLRLSRGYIW